MNNTSHAVSITIDSTQHDISGEAVQNIYTGRYRFVAGKHIISYDEFSPEDGASPLKSTNLLKIGSDLIHITKKGSITTQMRFQPSIRYCDVYRTPFGNFDMMIDTHEMSVQEKERELVACITYSLCLNHAPISKCTITITVKSDKPLRS